ncbi:TPA: hypothetical protein ACKR1B_003367 [Pseudomonas aeruginosa]|uniref:hypothetical protein n=2 Tax=Pseudomonas aeruginosa TaxID=287 RepID=UPI00053D2364|nr:hypothetical protein [Pseudomonas aeruginosa]ELH7348752.1 hypothetical protein [Pseudomonas aeruginosa]ELO2038768.1 hypothetical protein [Pseudomonas aeruginosa]MCO2142486.1 hypothetical protein [Pseudomonas aeruginosa]MCO2172141.1 hypothetical protein [Pseudomonas aeruginosa]MDP5558652.1 hypothetical protein [Pseudomonas aeruginosa]
MPEQISSNDLSWLDWKNEIQVKWALNYFAAQASIIPPKQPSPVDFDKLRTSLEALPVNDSATLLLTKAKNAWRQQKHRKQKAGHKAYNFVLPTEVQATLKQLARMRKTNMTEALKELIGEAFEKEKHHQKELKALQEKHKQAQERLTEKKQNAERQVKKHSMSITDQTLAARALATEIKDLLWQKVENELQITRALASPDERAALDELHAEELEKLKLRLPLQSRFDAFSSRPSQRSMPLRTIGSDAPSQPRTRKE